MDVSAARLSGHPVAVETLPDVGAPLSLVIMAVLGLLILSVGVAALMMARR